MKGPHATGIGLLLLVLLVLAGGCAPSGLPALLRSLSGPPETGSVAAPLRPHETSVVVSGTPTQVYALVARGILGCWFGAGGPLKGSHMFRAQAEPPAKGGAATIVIYERDATSPDQRGARSYRIAFAGSGAMVRAEVLALKFDRAFAELMAKDVAAWAKGGAGCRLRGLPPPQQTPVAGGADKRRAAAGKR